MGKIRNKKILILSLIFVLLLNIPVFAASENQIDNKDDKTATKSTDDHEGYTLSDDSVTWYKIVSGDGIYLIDGKPKQFSEEEYRKYRKAQKTDYLTEEQISQGWMLFNGYAYPPNDLQDERGLATYIRGEGDIDDSAPTGIVDFELSLEPGTQIGAFVKLMNAITYDTYIIEFYPTEHYKKEVTMNVGTYIICDGGLVGSDDPYITSESYFRVNENEHILVKVPIRKYEDAIKMGTEDIEENKADMEEYYAMESIRKETQKILGNDQTLSSDEVIDISKTKTGKELAKKNSDTPEPKKEVSAKTIYLIIGGILLLLLIALIVAAIRIYIMRKKEEE